MKPRNRSLHTAILFAAIAFTACLLATPRHAVAGCVARAGASPSPSPAPDERHLYSIGSEIYTLDRDATLFDYFQGNRDGSAKVKREIRYDRNLWDTCAQLQIRLPFITRYPNAPNAYSPEANPYSGFGNAELRYSYNVVSKTFDHSWQIGAAFPTESNGVESIDTQLKLFYNTKWKWSSGSVSYTNEIDQSVIRPPGSSETSYYEGNLSLPNVSFIDSPTYRGVKFSGIYYFRVHFNQDFLYQSAVGGIVNGNINDVAFNVIDTWGIGPNGLWKYKVEASAVVGLP